MLLFGLADGEVESLAIKFGDDEWFAVGEFSGAVEGNAGAEAVFNPVGVAGIEGNCHEKMRLNASSFSLRPSFNVELGD